MSLATSTLLPKKLASPERASKARMFYVAPKEEIAHTGISAPDLLLTCLGGREETRSEPVRAYKTAPDLEANEVQDVK